MNIAQVFYLARCASKTPEEREEIKAIEERYNKFMSATQDVIKTTRAPERHDVGSAQLILSLHHSAEASDRVNAVLTGYASAGGQTQRGDALLVSRGSPYVVAKGIASPRDSWEQACRTPDTWAQFLSYGYKAESVKRIDVLKAIDASYRAEHAEVPDWVQVEVLTAIHESLKAPLSRPTKKRKRRSGSKL
jgi:hypothetical protein